MVDIKQLSVYIQTTLPKDEKRGKAYIGFSTCDIEGQAKDGTGRLDEGDVVMVSCEDKPTFVDSFLLTKSDDSFVIDGLPGLDGKKLDGETTILLLEGGATPSLREFTSEPMFSAYQTRVRQQHSTEEIIEHPRGQYVRVGVAGVFPTSTTENPETIDYGVATPPPGATDIYDKIAALPTGKGTDFEEVNFDMSGVNAFVETSMGVFGNLRGLYTFRVGVDFDWRTSTRSEGEEPRFTERGDVHPELERYTFAPYFGLGLREFIAALLTEPEDIDSAYQFPVNAMPRSMLGVVDLSGKVAGRGGSVAVPFESGPQFHATVGVCLELFYPIDNGAFELGARACYDYSLTDIPVKYKEEIWGSPDSTYVAPHTFTLGVMFAVNDVEKEIKRTEAEILGPTRPTKVELDLPPAAPMAFQMISVTPLMELPETQDFFRSGKQDLSQDGKHHMSEVVPSGMKRYKELFTEADVPFGLFYTGVFGHADPADKATVKKDAAENFVALKGSVAQINKRVESDMNLSKARAGQGKLAINRGVSDKRLSKHTDICSDGYGESRPLNKEGNIIANFDPHNPAHYATVDFPRSRRVEIEVSTQPVACTESGKQQASQDPSLAAALEAELQKAGVTVHYLPDKNYLIALANADYKDANAPKPKSATLLRKIDRILRTQGKKFPANNLTVSLFVKPSVEAIEASEDARYQTLNDYFDTYTGWTLRGTFSVDLAKSDATLDSIAAQTAPKDVKLPHPPATDQEIQTAMAAAKSFGNNASEIFYPINMAAGKAERFKAETALEKMITRLKEQNDLQKVGLVISTPTGYGATKIATLFGGLLMDRVGKNRVPDGKVLIVQDTRLAPGLYLIKGDKELTADAIIAQYSAKYNK